MANRNTILNLRPITRKEKHLFNKKAQGFEAWFFIIIILLTFAIVFLVLNKAWTSIRTPLEEGLSSSMPTNTNVNLTKVMDQTGNTAKAWDKLVPFLIIGLFGFIMILAGGIIRHPIMIFVGIIILGVVITLAVIYSNVYNAISETDEFSTTKTNLPIQDLFMKYLPWITFIAAIAIVAGIMWTRSQGGVSVL